MLTALNAINLLKVSPLALVVLNVSTTSPPAAGASSTPVVASSVAGVSSAPVIVSTVSGASSAPVAASSPAAGSTGLVNPPATGYTGTPNLAAQGIQTFNVFERAGTGQSVNIEFIDASGNRVVYLLTSLGSAPARLVRRQGGNTAQVIQVDPPTVPISSTTSGSGTSTRSSTSSSTSAPATSIPTGTSINTSSGSTSRTASSSSSTSTNTGTGSGTANTGTTTGAGSPTTSPSTGMGTGTGAGEETGIPGSESDPSSAPAPTASGLGTVNPINIGGFTYLGCYGSPSSFPTFNLLLSAEAMTNDRCIAQCGPTGKRYAATFGRDCFCGDFIDDVNEIKTPEEQCNLSCPGNGRQVCGGRAANPVVKAKRQLPGVIPAVIRFSIYVRNGAAPPGVSGVPSGTAVIPGTTNPCANGRCPNIPCYGDDCYKIIVCYGGYCAFNFPCFGSDCHRRLVCNDGIWRPEACTGYDCGRKVVCVSGHCNYVEKGMAEWNEKVTCHGNYCQVEKCSGDACNQKYVCKDGSCVFTNSTAADALNKYEWSGDKYTVVNSCEPNCPKPQPPCATCGIVISQAPVTQTTCVGASCSTVVVPQPPITKVPYQTAQPTAQPPAETGKVVVVAGTIKFAASVGAVVFGVMAAAILL
ncbi:WSC domain-containing protein [Colletotrichum truncatum]|uniref:WSC domain-containing protein n=1 Tax=Colletotrichum truncatum TaxID=5467 RepID=A0ACC3ZLB1_COLTU